jgi:hypothetical protein
MLYGGDVTISFMLPLFNGRMKLRLSVCSSVASSNSGHGSTCAAAICSPLYELLHQRRCESTWKTRYVSFGVDLVLRYIPGRRVGGQGEHFGAFDLWMMRVTKLPVPVPVKVGDCALSHFEEEAFSSSTNFAAVMVRERLMAR